MKKNKPDGAAHFRLLSRDDVETISRALSSTQNEHRNRAVFFLGLGAGLQLSEICNLRLDGVLASGNVKKIIQVGAANSVRQVYLSAQSRTYLEVHVQTLATHNPDQMVFFSPTDPSSPIATHSLTIMFRRLFKHLEMPNVSFYSFRKTHAVALRKMGIDKNVIKNQLGIRTKRVLDHYLDVPPENDKLAIEFLKF